MSGASHSRYATHQSNTWFIGVPSLRYTTGALCVLFWREASEPLDHSSLGSSLVAPSSSCPSEVHPVPAPTSSTATTPTTHLRIFSRQRDLSRQQSVAPGVSRGRRPATGSLRARRLSCVSSATVRGSSCSSSRSAFWRSPCRAMASSSTRAALKI